MSATIVSQTTAPILPIIYRALYHANLKLIKSLSNNSVVCVDTQGKRYVLKPCRNSEDFFYTRIMPAIQTLALPFSTLVLPKHADIITVDETTESGKISHKFIVLDYYEGPEVTNAWHELSAEGLGGRGLPLALADKAIALLADFATIDAKIVAQCEVPTFNFSLFRQYNLPIAVRDLKGAGYLSEEQAQKATNLITMPFAFVRSKMVLTNGDFYPRNFIELHNGKVVVVDWEHRIDYTSQVGSSQVNSQRTVFYNYIENHVAFLFVHMWGNPRFQKRLIQLALSHFALTHENIRRAIVLKSLEQAHYWQQSGEQYLALRQLEIFNNALDKNYIFDLLPVRTRQYQPSIAQTRALSNLRWIQTLPGLRKTSLLHIGNSRN